MELLEKFKNTNGPYELEARIRGNKGSSISYSEWQNVSCFLGGVSEKTTINEFCVTHTLKIPTDESKESGHAAVKVIKILDSFDVPWKQAKEIGERFQLKSSIAEQFTKVFNKDVKISFSYDSEVDTLDPEIIKKLDHSSSGISFMKLRSRNRFHFNGNVIDVSCIRSGKFFDDIANSRMTFEVEIEATKDSPQTFFDTIDIITRSLVANVNPRLILETRETRWRHSKVLPFKGQDTADYLFSLKLDGQHGTFFMKKTGSVLILDKEITLDIPYIQEMHLDVELYAGKIYVFDANVPGDLFTRIATYKKFVDLLGDPFIAKDHYPCPPSPVDALEYDGLILTKKTSAFGKEEPLKYKDSVTIDFEIKIVEKTENDEAWELYACLKGGNVLFAPMWKGNSSSGRFINIERNKMSTIRVAYPYAYLYNDKDVVEFSMDNGNLVPNKKRPDKVRGNHIAVVMDNLALIKNNIKPVMTSMENPEPILENDDSKDIIDIKEPATPVMNRTPKNKTFPQGSLINKYLSYFKRKIIAESDISGDLVDLYASGGDVQKWIDNKIRDSVSVCLSPEEEKIANEKCIKLSDNKLYKNYNFSVVSDLSCSPKENLACFHTENFHVSEHSFKVLERFLSCDTFIGMIFDGSGSEIKNPEWADDIPEPFGRKCSERLVGDLKHLSTICEKRGLLLEKEYNLLDFTEEWLSSRPETFTEAEIKEIQGMKAFVFKRNVKRTRNRSRSRSPKKVKYDSVDLLSKKVADLKILCKNEKISTSGKKSDLVEKLLGC